jgi:glycosyltransferase involved in cell wall biosynthesis
VIVPVRGAAEELSRCLTSILRHTDLRENGLIVVEDAGADPAVEEHLARLMERTELSIHVLRNPSRKGFVGSVNAGMQQSERDVILLNSDTEVTAGWLEKMRYAAYSSPDVATVTPFSNDATICSLPVPLEHNELPAGHDVNSFGALVETVSPREYPRLPTGVGMCLFIKREALDRLGYFDESSFGLGYGEENEFCFRALEAGFVHVLDDSTFVYHAGGRSFQSAARALKRTGARRLSRIHPAYLPTIAAFLREDPLRPARKRVLHALRPAWHPSPPTDPFRRVVHLVHGWPPWSHAGTELYARWLATSQAPLREVSAYARVGDPESELGDAREYLDAGVRVRLMVNNFTQRDPFSRNSLTSPTFERDFDRFLDRLRPDLLHVHHLVGHAASLLSVAHRRGVPILYQAQDWWPACARVNLTHRSLTLCSGPGVSKCAACIPLTRLPPSGVTNRALHLFRTRWLRRQLRLPKAFVMGSRFIERTYRDLGLLPAGTHVFVRSYGVPLADQPLRRRERPAGGQRPLRFGYVGSILPHKGVHVAAEAFREVTPDRAVLEIWGDTTASPAYTASLQAHANPEVVELRGPFPEDTKARLLGELDALIVPSIGYESFGLVAREAIAVGTPVLAARGSALDELLDAGGGVAFAHDDPKDLRRLVLQLVERPEALARQARSLPPVKGFAAHAEEMNAVYAEVGRLIRRGPAPP